MIRTDRASRFSLRAPFPKYLLPDGFIRIYTAGKLAYSEKVFDIFAIDETTVMCVTLTLKKNNCLSSGETFCLIDSRDG